jgi:hypothetical protein
VCGMILRTATNSLNSHNSEHSLFVVSQELQFEVIFRHILCLKWWEAIDIIVVNVWRLFRSLFYIFQPQLLTLDSWLCVRFFVLALL